MTDEKAQEKLTDAEKVQHVKNNLKQTHIGFHNNLLHFIDGLPITEDHKKFAFANLIQSFHWVQDGIEFLKFEVEDPTTLQTKENCNSAEVENKPEGDSQC